MRARRDWGLKTLTMVAALLAAVVIAPSVSPAMAQDTAAPAAPAHDLITDVRQIWQLVDYIAVDYVEAVADGAVKNDGEYAEMTEFAATVRTRLAGMPARDGHSALLTQAEALQSAIAAKAPPSEVAQRSNALSAALVSLYPIPVAPAKAPDLTQAAALYREQCGACHGCALQFRMLQLRQSLHLK